MSQHNLSNKAPIDRMTRKVEFTRQLWPQPPKNSRPYFCLINTLCFIDEDHETLWQQKIPEGLIKWDFDKKGVRLDSHRNIVHMNGPLDLRVEWDETWGWLLRFYLTHEEAFHVWGEYLKFRTPEPYVIEPAYTEKVGRGLNLLEEAL